MPPTGLLFAGCQIRCQIPRQETKFLDRRHFLLSLSTASPGTDGLQDVPGRVPRALVDSPGERLRRGRGRDVESLPEFLQVPTLLAVLAGLPGLPHDGGQLLQPLVGGHRPVVPRASSEVEPRHGAPVTTLHRVQRVPQPGQDTRDVISHSDYSLLTPPESSTPSWPLSDCWHRRRLSSSCRCPTH